MPEMIMGGAGINYEDVGSGDAVLLVHGWIGSGALWDLMLPGLAGAFRVVVPDLPGHGDSGIPRGFSFDLGGFSDFLDTVREELSLSRIGLVGHSMGGSIALFYAANHPEVVKGLVLMDAPASTRALTWPARLPFLERALAVLHYFWSPGIVSRMIKSSVRHPERLPGEWLARAGEQASKLKRQALLETTRLVRHLDLDREASGVLVPTLVMHGDRDGSVKLSEAYRLRDMIVDAKLRVMSDCGHCPNYEYPDEASAAVLDFLAG